MPPKLYQGLHSECCEATFPIEYFITSDNLLSNKAGIEKSVIFPKGTLIAYSKGDILIGNIRPYLKKIWFANKDGVCSPDVLVFRAKPGYDPTFLYYSVLRDDFFDHMMRGAKGTKMPRGDKNQTMRFLIPDFRLDYQQRIGALLSDIDSKISLNNRINAELEAMAKTLYDYWFVQFDFPNKNGKPYKASGGKMVWNEELKREIPEGWRAGTLSEISDIVRGVSYSANDIKDKNERVVVPILRATNISGNVIDLQNMVYVPGEFVSDKQVLNKFDILITMSSGSKDHIGKNGFYYFDEHVAFGAFCAKLVAKVNYRYYLYSYTQSDFMFTTIKNESLGTNINNLNGTMVAGFKLVIPPKELIKKFNFKVESVFEKIGLNIRENQKLTELRDWLLPMLMNGQIKIKDAESELAMAAEPTIEWRRR